MAPPPIFNWSGHYVDLYGSWSDGDNIFRASKQVTPGTGVDDPSKARLTGQFSIDGPDGQSFLFLAVREGRTLNFDIDFANVDSRLVIRDGWGNLLVEADGGPGTDVGSPSNIDPALSYTADFTGFLYIGLGAQDGKSTGSGTVHIAASGLGKATKLTNGANILQQSFAINQRIFAKDGNDIIDGTGSTAYLAILGGDGDDITIGGTMDDALIGGAGDDNGGGKQGNDVIDGGRGNDDYQGGEGDDQIQLGRGNDTGIGDVGDDYIWGGSGNDIVTPGLGDDKASGGAGKDTYSCVFSPFGVTIDMKAGTAAGEGADDFQDFENVFGTAQGDTVKGDNGDNELTGFQGDDVLFGGRGSDLLKGGGDKDLLFGEAGNDYLAGEDGDDTLDGGAGADDLSGGAGADVFFFKTGHSSVGAADTVQDFDGTVDLVNVTIVDADSNQPGQQNFDFIGDAAFSNKAGELRRHLTEFGNTELLGDTDGDGTADFAVTFVGVHVFTEGVNLLTGN